MNCPICEMGERCVTLKEKKKVEIFDGLIQDVVSRYETIYTCAACQTTWATFDRKTRIIICGTTQSEHYKNFKEFSAPTVSSPVEVQPEV